MDREDREFYLLRFLMVLVAGPTGALVAGAAVASENGDSWWPWVVGAVLWLLVGGTGIVAVWLRMGSRPRGQSPDPT
jgi:Na+/citrate or Na+/malate symporter